MEQQQNKRPQGQQFVQSIIVNLEGQLSITMVPRQNPDIKRLLMNGKKYFLNVATNDGSNNTANTGFYLLMETTADFTKKEPEPEAAPAADLPAEETLEVTLDAAPAAEATEEKTAQE